MKYLMIFIIVMLLIVSIFAQDTIEILMDCDKTIIAHFKKIQYTLNTLADPTEGGTVTGAGTYDINTIIDVEATANPDYVFDHWNVKWSGLGMAIFSSGDNVEEVSPSFEDWVDTLLANGFEELRIDIPAYEIPTWVADSKVAVLSAISKGAKVIWGVNAGAATITAANWNAARLAILDGAQWAQDNGVFEFQLGNEQENHNDDDTLTDEQLILNL